ncbi:type II secretion system protein [uncultured Campylobacter sp.]|uniref:type II secretion system protein n=1 Tax=uncultured Campylobacter sp. TaxID=218934 RepID=UPI0026237040|nr:type II secretion system protein [uncultured Campylobacter sp.]
MEISALLNQLGYNENDATAAQVKRILNNCDGLNLSSIVTLNDHLKPLGGFVAMSGSEDVFKIKNAGKTPDALNVIENWAEKNKINIKKVNETTHYILGKNI